jgi:hypothetical protein
MITENLSTLKIHKLDQEQFKREKLAGKLDETAFYLTPEDGLELDSTLTQEGKAADAKAVGDAISSISTAQPDWNQNDSSAPDYIKNRTHWIGSGKSTLYSGNLSSTGSPLGEDYLGAGGHNYNEYLADLSFPDSLSTTATMPDSFKVMVNGGEYCLPVCFESGLSSGSLSEYRVKMNESDYIALGYTYWGRNVLVVYYTEGLRGADLKIFIDGEIYHAIDERFIPTSIARKTELPALVDQYTTIPDWNIENEDGDGFIRNRTHGRVYDLNIVYDEECIAGSVSTDLGYKLTTRIASKYMDAFRPNTQGCIQLLCDPNTNTEHAGYWFYTCSEGSESSTSTMWVKIGDNIQLLFVLGSTGYSGGEYYWDLTIYSNVNLDSGKLKVALNMVYTKTLDEEYIPETIARTSQLDSVGKYVNFGDLLLDKDATLETYADCYVDISSGAGSFQHSYIAWGYPNQPKWFRLTLDNKVYVLPVISISKTHLHGGGASGQMLGNPSMYNILYGINKCEDNGLPFCISLGGSNSTIYISPSNTPCYIKLEKCSVNNINHAYLPKSVVHMTQLDEVRELVDKITPCKDWDDDLATSAQHIENRTHYKIYERTSLGSAQSADWISYSKISDRIDFTDEELRYLKITEVGSNDPISYISRTFEYDDCSGTELCVPYSYWDRFVQNDAVYSYDRYYPIVYIVKKYSDNNTYYKDSDITSTGVFVRSSRTSAGECVNGYDLSIVSAVKYKTLDEEFLPDSVVTSDDYLTDEQFTMLSNLLND